MKKPVKVTYVVSGVDYSLGFLWIAKGIDQSKYKLDFIFLAKSKPSLHQQFLSEGISSRYIKCGSKKDYLPALLKFIWIFLFKRPDILHAQLIESGLLSLPAAWLLRIKKRIYTRHHATYNSEYYPHMVKYDKLINSLATHLVAISNNVAEVLMQSEGVKKEKITVIPHGFMMEPFIQPDQGNILKLKEKYNPKSRGPVIGVISRFIELKGLQYVIPAFKEFLQTEPDAYLIMANANGNYTHEIDRLLATLPPESYQKIGFEKDLFSLYGIFDYFIHVPINPSVEAYGQVYVESLAAGIPSIFTLSGIARDFIRNNENALVVPFKNTAAISEALNQLHHNKQLREHLIENGRKDAVNMFNFEKSLHHLYELYA
jgi:glycosyltransferase involved in cell wall biosynthesis